MLPVYGRHLLFRPYRTDLPPAAGGRGREIAAYDLFLNLLLSGFTEFTGRPVRQGTAQLLILVNRIAFLMDDEFERRIGRESVHFDDLATAANVERAIADLRAYLGSTCDPSRCDLIRQALRQTVDTEYRRYATSIENRRAAPSVDDLLEDAGVDCGAVMRQLAEITGLFQGVDAPKAALDDFCALGLACRFADDLRDWQKDSETGAGNILLSTLARHPNEARRLTDAQKSRTRMNEKQWCRLCPTAFAEFTRLYEEHYAHIRSKTLRIAADLMMEPGRSGHRATADGVTAARA
ncbi:class 1 isoprenoid biosynthesis enzyme [Streptomyces sp. HUCO-GS316]|uniref:class 1 isoprenoid biosynthesis enzyme n=1 Tax=Streptomyces sp. HUCO-GS316 TaxID=2692198 RepID=UPI001370079B|nr:class 1 isoprenoid biosynthesis enzyme [Streptomyces sp. HUCO-GS316]